VLTIKKFSKDVRQLTQATLDLREFVRAIRKLVAALFFLLLILRAALHLLSR